MELIKCRDVRWKGPKKRNKPDVAATTAKHPDSRSTAGAISFPELRSPWPAVGKRELWEQPLWKNKGNNRILVIRLTAHLHLWRMPEMVAPRALVFRPLVKGNEALGTRLRLEATGVHAQCLSFLGKFTSGSRISASRISASRSDLL